jgi:hypothetical protein
MKMKTISYTTNSFTQQSNELRELFLGAMLMDGHITQEQYDDMIKYCFVICEKGFFGKLWNKLWDKSDDINIMIVKILE